MSEINEGAEASENEPEQVEQEQAPEQEEGSEGGQVDGKAEELKAQIQQADTKSEKKALEKKLKKYELKVNGKLETLEVDLDDDVQMQKHLQMARASQVKMQESAELRKAADEFIQLLKTNPRKVLTDPNISVDLKKLAQEIMNEEIENAAKSPEQLEKEKLQKELEDLKGKFEKEDKDRKEREFSRLQAEQEEKIQGDIESALQSNELPKTPYTVRKMAEMMMLALQNDIDLSPKDLVPLLRKQMTTDIKELFGASSDEILEEMIGKERISSIRKKKIAQVQKQVAQTASSVKPTGKASDVKEEKKSEGISMRDFLKGKF